MNHVNNKIKYQTWIVVTVCMKSLVNPIMHLLKLMFIQGDVLVLDCNYTTTDREGVVLVCMQCLQSQLLTL